MMSASLSLSLPRLGWKSTSTPRSLKICTAAGESASEMRTFGLDIGYGSFENRAVVPAEAPLGAQSRDPYSQWWLLVPSLRGEGPRARDDDRENYAAFAKVDLVSADEQSLHCCSTATS